jgi:GNAT superfamily N-acetyltransferase
MGSPKVTTFHPKYLPAYVELNREWIEHYFKIEPMDIAQLQDAQKSILDPGGEIFFVIEDDEAVGTCAMVPHGPGCFELAKMAVNPSTRGKGYGDLLMKTAIAWARRKSAERIILLSNTVLTPAITLYNKYGFKTLHLGPHPDYERCNIEMELMLKSEAECVFSSSCS